MIEKAQAVATLDATEVKMLLEAMAFIWASLVAACGLIYKIGSSWVSKVNAEIDQLKADVAKIPGIIAKAIAEHNADDESRHLIQMKEIRSGHDAYAAPWAEMQVKQEALRERVESLEDTGPRRHR